MGQKLTASSPNSTFTPSCCVFFARMVIMTWLSVWYQSCLIWGDFLANSTAAPAFDVFGVSAILRSSELHKLCKPVLSKWFSLKHKPQLRYKNSQPASVRLCRQIDNAKSAYAQYPTLFSQRTFDPLHVTAPEGTTETVNFSQSENFLDYVTG